MKNWMILLLILALLGFVIGYVIGPSFYKSPKCDVDPITMEEDACMGNPNNMRVPVGLIGGLFGVIISLSTKKILFKK